MSLEKIVRPFQLGDIFDARVLPPVQLPVTPAPDVETSWGSGNSGNYVQFALSGLVGGKVTYKEKDRVTRTVRVTNPSDSSQFVDVQRIEQLRLASNEGHEITFKMNNP